MGVVRGMATLHDYIILVMYDHFHGLFCPMKHKFQAVTKKCYSISRYHCIQGEPEIVYRGKR